LAKGGSSGRIFLRRALIAAAFSSANGDSARDIVCFTVSKATTNNR
ncbi:unnamed protein product, partial [Musa hybrid cultivar]